MNNLEKLLKFLVKENDYKELVLKTGVEETTAKKFTMDIFARIIPSDFNKVEGSHIDEKDLIGIVNNFNAVVKEDNLKQLIASGVKKYGLEVKQASSLLMAVLPVIHSNIQKLTNPQKVQETKKAEKSEADKIYENISSRANEEIKPVEKQENSQPKQAEETKTEVEETEESEVLEDDNKLSTLEKVCIYVVLACLVALVITFVVILVL